MLIKYFKTQKEKNTKWKRENVNFIYPKPKYKEREKETLKRRPTTTTTTNNNTMNELKLTWEQWSNSDVCIVCAKPHKVPILHPQPHKVPKTRVGHNKSKLKIKGVLPIMPHKDFQRPKRSLAPNGVYNSNYHCYLTSKSRVQSFRSDPSFLIRSIKLMQSFLTLTCLADRRPIIPETDTHPPTFWPGDHRSGSLWPHSNPNRSNPNCLTH